MNTPNDNTSQQGFRGWWSSPPRSGMRRIISPFEYRHLRFFAQVRIATGAALVGLGVVTLAFGGNDRETYAWATAFFAMGAAQLGFAGWLLSISRSAPAVA